MARYTIEGDTVGQLLDGFRQVIAQEAATGAMRALETALGEDGQPIEVAETPGTSETEVEERAGEDGGGDVGKPEMPTMIHRARAQREFGLTWSEIRRAERGGELSPRKRGHLVMYPVAQLRELANRLGRDVAQVA